MFKSFLELLFSGILIFSFTGCVDVTVNDLDKVSMAQETPLSIPEVADFRARVTNVRGNYWRVTEKMDFGFFDKSKFSLPHYVLVHNKSVFSKFSSVIADYPIDFRRQYPEYSISNVNFVDENQSYAALNRFSTGINDSNDLSKIVKTTNRGKSWETVYENNAIIISSIVFANEDTGWAVGRQSVNESYFDRRYIVLRTLDQGKTWTDVSETMNQVVLRRFENVNDELTDLYSDSSTSATALSLGGRIFRTIDNGRTWNLFTVLPFEPLQTCLCQIGQLEQGEIWVAGGANSDIEGQWGVLAILKHDGTWLRNQLPGVSFNQVKFVSANGVFAVGSMREAESANEDVQRAVILFSSDLGKNWEVIHQSQQSVEFVSVAVLSADRVVAIDSNGILVSVVDTRKSPNS